MDKLKQVLLYQFWILLGVALIVPFVGWGMSRSGMMAEAEARTKELKSIGDQLTVKSDDPNKTWAERVEVINSEQEKQRDLAWRALFDRQAPFKVWPEGLPEGAAQFADENKETFSRTAYLAELEQVRKIVKPYDEEQQEGLCVFGEELLPPPPEDWKFRLPYNFEIEAVQEDVWLLTAILSAVARVNESATSIQDAPIREIVELLLSGGSPKGSTAGGGAKTAGGAAGGHVAPAGMARMPGMGGTTSDTKGGSIVDPKIDLNEDLGLERPASNLKAGGDNTGAPKVTGGPAAGHAAAPGGNSATALGMPTTMGGSAAGGGARRGGFDKERYCDDKTKEWKTRGFSLEVIMDHRRLADLLVALSNCEGWPVNILRVHVADLKDEDLVPADGGGAGDMSPARPAMSRMMMGAGGGHAGLAAGTGAHPMAGADRRMATPRMREAGGERTANTPLPMEDPNLAKVAIVGVIYIFQKPPEPKATPAVPQTPGTVPAASPVGGASPPPATSAAAETETPAAGTAEEPTGNAEEKPDATDGKDETTAEPVGDAPAAPAAQPDTKPKPAAGTPGPGNSG
jgi:hypothetical protein